MFDVYQWEQELFDGTTEIFERLKRPDTVLIIPTKDTQIFYAHEEQPDHRKFLSLFGGRVDEEEDHLLAAKRELAEESGLVSDDWKLLATFSPVFKIEWNIHLYVARGVEKMTDIKLDPGEKIETRSTNLETFLELLEKKQFRGQEVKNFFYRIRHDDKAMSKLHKTLFG